MYNHVSSPIIWATELCLSRKPSWIFIHCMRILRVLVLWRNSIRVSALSSQFSSRSAITEPSQSIHSSHILFTLHHIFIHVFHSKIAGHWPSFVSEEKHMLVSTIQMGVSTVTILAAAAVVSSFMVISGESRVYRLFGPSHSKNLLLVSKTFCERRKMIFTRVDREPPTLEAKPGLHEWSECNRCRWIQIELVSVRLNTEPASSLLHDIYVHFYVWTQR